MKCTEIEKQIDSFISNELDFAEKQKINLHLQECATCRKEIKEIQEASDLLKTLPAIPFSNQFDVRMMQAFREHKQEQAKPTFWQALLAGFSISKPALALGLLVIAIFTGFAFQLGRMTSPKTGNSEISINNQSEQKGEPLVQVVEKRVEVPVIKTVEVPVYKERVLNRVIYKTIEVVRNVKSPDENQNQVSIYAYNSQKLASMEARKMDELFHQVNLKEFQPITDMKTQIMRKDSNNEK